ncbi:hypothetical protein DT603_11650 [Pseudoxanthomonas gei]|uniref:Uncharacterized protein n=2 Tax=Pseudoxanthomonas gei TaxID=1383030 RepID=A0ABX0AD38_9GAMM|nr:hypothetical protein [Pseudoxanthomonas gei]
MGGLLLVVAGGMQAQEDARTPEADGVPTLERVQAELPDEEAIDLYRFQNPVVVAPSRFAEAYKPGPSLEEISLEHGGLINYGINLGLQKTWWGVKRITGMRPQTQTAVARASPLDEAQLQRAASRCETRSNDCASGQ